MKKLAHEQVPDFLTAEYLAQGSLFGALSYEGIAYLLTEGRILHLDRGDRVFNIGERGEAFYIVLEGTLNFYKHHNGITHLTRNIGFAEETGFVAMIALHDHVGYAEADESSLVLEVSSTLFGRFQATFPIDFGILTLNLARDMARTIRKLSNNLVNNVTEYET